MTDDFEAALRKRYPQSAERLDWSRGHPPPREQIQQHDKADGARFGARWVRENEVEPLRRSADALHQCHTEDRQRIADLEAGRRKPSDVADRLRALAPMDTPGGVVCHEAADHIEQLEGAVADLEAGPQGLALGLLRTRIAELEAALHIARAWINQHASASRPADNTLPRIDRALADAWWRSKNAQVSE